MESNYSVYSDIEIYITHIIESNITYKPSNFEVIDPEKTANEVMKYLNKISVQKHSGPIKNENINVS